MTADRAVLREQIARALFDDDHADDTAAWRNERWASMSEWARDIWRARADAVMPLVSDALAAVEAEAQDFETAANQWADDARAQEERARRYEAERDAARESIRDALAVEHDNTDIDSWIVSAESPPESDKPDEENAYLLMVGAGIMRELADGLAAYRKEHP